MSQNYLLLRRNVSKGCCLVVTIFISRLSASAAPTTVRLIVNLNKIMFKIEINDFEIIEVIY